MNLSVDQWLERVELPTIGHYPQVEAPAEVVEAYLRFLRQL